MRTALTIWRNSLLALLAGLAACSSPSKPATETPAAPDIRTRYTARRVLLPNNSERGRILDRHDSVLVAYRPQFLLRTPARAPLDTLALGHLLGWDSTTVRRRFAQARPNPAGGAFPVRLRLTDAEVKRMRRDSAAWPTLRLLPVRRRVYTSPAGAHVLGYLPAEAQSFFRQARSTAHGRFYRLRNGGVESYYNGLLTGHNGYRHPLLDAAGRQHGSWTRDTVLLPGQDLHLTIDAGLQAYAEKLLGNRKGYVVALEPSTGEILCLVSGPVFPASTLSAPDQAGTRARLLDSEEMPLLNRAATLANPPGSVFKLVNAAVALQLGAITPATGFRCDQSLITCVHDHPRPKNLTVGLKYSCNPYFYQVMRNLIERLPDSLGQDSVTARHANLAQWRRYVRSFGLDSVLGVDLPREAPGFLPTPVFYDKARQTVRWTYRSIYSLSIGQGEINLTGLQMANMAAIVANRGWYYRPHLVRSVGTSGPLPRYLKQHRTLIDSVNLEALVPGMIGAMQRGGTAEASSLEDVGITVAGKTGTVQNDEGDDHAAFVGFAPATNPRIVVAVYLENAGFGATAAAPCAALVMEKYLRGRIAPRRKWWETRMQRRYRAE